MESGRFEERTMRKECKKADEILSEQIQHKCNSLHQFFAWYEFNGIWKITNWRQEFICTRVQLREWSIFIQRWETFAHSSNGITGTVVLLRAEFPSKYFEASLLLRQGHQMILEWFRVHSSVSLKNASCRALHQRHIYI